MYDHKAKRDERIKKRRGQDMPFRDLAKEFGVSKSTAHRVSKNKPGASKKERGEK